MAPLAISGRRLLPSESDWNPWKRVARLNGHGRQNHSHRRMARPHGPGSRGDSPPSRRKFEATRPAARRSGLPRVQQTPVVAVVAALGAEVAGQRQMMAGAALFAGLAEGAAEA